LRWIEEEAWLRDAVKFVKFPPDRRRVREELYEHMISRNLGFLAQGYSEEEADRLTCMAMGEAEDVSRALAEVHKPFWGYLLRALRILLVAVLLFGIVVTIFNRRDGNFRYFRSILRGYEAYGAVWIRQDAAQSCGDYRFRLRKAAVAGPGIRETFLPEGEYNLVLLLRASTWDPDLGAPDYSSMTVSLEDSLGNRYPAHAHAYRELIFFSDVVVYVPRFDPSAEWAVLILEAGDRELRFPVTLKGASP